MGNHVSVIVTCHNLDRYIAAAISSVTNQDFQEPFEIIVVDDCSIDTSPEIIQQFEGVVYARTPENLGVLMATVHGFERSTGDLVFFLDGDDIWEQSKLSAMVNRFRADTSLALLTHDLSYIDSSGKFIERASRPGTVMAGIDPQHWNEATRDGILLHNDHVWLGSAFAVRRSLGKVGEFCEFTKTLPDPFNTYQDWPLAYWVAAQNGVSFGYIDEKLFRYRLHGANYSGDSTSVEKAVRNTKRALNTTLALLDIAKRFCLDQSVVNMTSAKVEYCRYQLEILHGHRWMAAIAFVRGLPFITRNRRLAVKECVRYFGIVLLGPQRFTKMKHRFQGAA